MKSEPKYDSIPNASNNKCYLMAMIQTNDTKVTGSNSKCYLMAMMQTNDTKVTTLYKFDIKINDYFILVIIMTLQ